MKMAGLLKVCFVAVLTAGIVTVSTAAEAGSGNFGERGQRSGMRGQRGQRGMRGRGQWNMGNMFGVDRFVKESELRAKYPAEMAELEKARAEVAAKYNALAAKAGVEIAESMEDKMRRLRAADSAAFDAVIAKFSSDGREAVKELFALAEKHKIVLRTFRNTRSRRERAAAEEEAPKFRQSGRPDMRALRKKYPEDMKKYDELRRENPEAARKLLLELVRKNAAGTTAENSK